MDMRKLRGFAAGITASSIWGGMYVVSKIVLETIPSFSLLTLRLLLGILVLGGISLIRPRYMITKSQIISIVMMGFIGFGVSLAFQFIGTSLSTAANASVVTSATPAFVFLFASMILRESITPKRFLALAISTVGVLIIVNPFSKGISIEMYWGELCLVAAALTWALYSVLVRRYRQGIPMLEVSLIALVGGLVVSVPFAMFEITQAVWWPVDRVVVFGVLYLGIVSTALAFYLWNKAFEILDAGPAGLTFFAQPVVGGFLGWYFLGDDINANFLLGGMMILFGIWLVSLDS